MLKSNVFFLVFLLSLFFGVSPVIKAQSTAEERIANSLYARSDYERATSFYERLYQAAPQNALYFERFANCLIYTKQDEKARALIERVIDKNEATARAAFLAMQHLEISLNKTEIALEALLSPPEAWKNDPQYYFQAGRLLTDYQNFEAALEVYRAGREQLSIEGIFRNEMAMTALQAGFYQTSVEEFLSLIASNPKQQGYVQRLWLRYGDQELMDEATFQLEERIAQAKEVETRLAMGKLLLWCLQELKLDQRALFWAKKMESDFKEQGYFPVYMMGNAFSGTAKFDLAKEAFTYYFDQTDNPIRERALSAFIQTEKNRIEEIRKEATLPHQEIQEAWQQLSDSVDVFLSDYELSRGLQTELRLQQVRLYSLNLGQIDKADRLLSSLRVFRDEHKKEKQLYEGVLLLLQGELSRARIALSQCIRSVPANRTIDDEAAYFLALSELMNRQPEFASLQLKRFKEDNSSYFANEALFLRKMLIEASGGSDSLKSEELYEWVGASLAKLKAERTKQEQLLTKLCASELPTYKNRAWIQRMREDFAISEDELTSLGNELLLMSSPMAGGDELLWEFYLYLSRHSSSSTALSSNFSTQLLEQLLVMYPNSIFAPNSRKKLTEELRS